MVATENPAVIQARGMLLPVLVLSACCLLASVQITGRPVIKDASETLTMALNLAHHGVMSLDVQPPLRPSMARDPLPVWTTAAAIRCEDFFMGEGTAASYFHGERAQRLKLQNELWLAMLMGTAALAAHRLAGPYGGGRWQLMCPILGGFLAAWPFTLGVPRGAEYAIGMDSLDTELPAAMWLLLGAFLLIVAHATRRPVWLVLVSTVFGIMALTKAAVLYVYPAILLLVWLAHRWMRAPRMRAPRMREPRMREPRIRAPRIQVPRWTASPVTITAAALLPFLLLCGSWMVRNQQQTGLFTIGERGGPVMLYRGLLDTMSGEEYRGAFYAWTDWPLQGAIGKIMGFTRSDLSASGRLHRLQMGFAGSPGEQDATAEDEGRPDLALSWYRKSRAIYEDYLHTVSAEGARYPSGLADRMTRDDGIVLAEEHPLMHLAVAIPLIWRGARFSFPVLLLSLLYARRTRRTELVIFGVPALVIIVFYAMTSHFAQRYGWVPRPCALLLLMAVAAGLLQQRWLPLRRGGAPRSVGEP